VSNRKPKESTISSCRTENAVTVTLRSWWTGALVEVQGRLGVTSGGCDSRRLMTAPPSTAEVATGGNTDVRQDCALTAEDLLAKSNNPIPRLQKLRKSATLVTCGRSLWSTHTLASPYQLTFPRTNNSLDSSHERRS